MTVRRSLGPGPRPRRLLLSRLTLGFPLVALALAFAGCRDLSFPAGDPAANPGPVVRFLSPSPDDVVPLVAPVRVSAEDVNGVRQVTLSCGGSVIRTWVSAPFEGQVSLGPCLGAASGDGGASRVALALTAQATDALGNEGEPVSVSFEVDLDSVALSTTLPDRVLPRSTLAFEVAADRPLQAPPEVQVEGLEATVQQLPGSGMTRFSARFSPTPGLGTERFSGDGGAVPFSVIEDLERTLPVTVTAVAQNGNQTRLDLTVLLSRVRWSRSVPGGISPPLTETGEWVRAVGVGAGLALHVPGNGVGSFWVPAWMEAGQGALSVVPSGLLLSREGLAPAAFDGRGRAVLHTDFYGPPEDWLAGFGGTSWARLPDGLSSSSDAGVSSTLELAGEALCRETVNPNAGCAATYRVSCLEPDGGITVSSTPTGGGSEGIVRSTLMVRSGPVQLNIVQHNIIGPTCCSGTSGCTDRPELLGPPDKMVFRKILSPLDSLARVLPVGDGTFVLTHVVNAPSTDRVDASGLPAGHYFGLERIEPSDVVAAAADGAVIALRRPAPNTQTLVEAWRPDATTPALSYALPGYWSFVAGMVPELPTNAIVDAKSGDIAMLLQVGSLDQEQYRVAVFDSQLRPRWIFNYPLSVSSTKYKPALVSDEPGSSLYLVDYANQSVTALAW